MPPKKNRKPAQPVRQRRNKANPDEYRREGLVTVDHDSFSAMLFMPQQLKGVETATPGILYQNRSDIVQEKYIVQVRRVGGLWEYTVEIGGVETKLPGKVFDRLASYRQSILKEQRRDRADNQLRRVAAADQVEAAREPDDPAVSTWSAPTPTLWGWTMTTWREEPKRIVRDSTLNVMRHLDAACLQRVLDAAQHIQTQVSAMADEYAESPALTLEHLVERCWMLSDLPPITARLNLAGRTSITCTPRESRPCSW